MVPSRVGSGDELTWAIPAVPTRGLSQNSEHSTGSSLTIFPGGLRTKRPASAQDRGLGLGCVPIRELGRASGGQGEQEVAEFECLLCVPQGPPSQKAAIFYNQAQNRRLAAQRGNTRRASPKKNSW